MSDSILVHSKRNFPAISTTLLSEFGNEVFDVKIHRGNKEPKSDTGRMVDLYNGRYLFFNEASNTYTYHVSNDVLLEKDYINREDVIKLIRLFNMFTGMFYYLVD